MRSGPQVMLGANDSYVIVTSHQAFLTREALNNIAATTVDNLLKFKRGEAASDTEVCYRCVQ